MTIQKLMSQPLTVQAVGGTTLDAYGNSVPGPVGAPVAEFGFLEQKDTVEYLLNRDTVVSKWKAFLFPTSTVTELAYINFGGQQFQVDGAPWHVFNPRAKAVSHIECKLIVVS